MQRVVSLALLLGLAFALPAAAWWETGHQVVARIAAAQLSPAARTRVARILGVDDSANAVADALAKASTWADETKAETKTGNWHFIDLAEQDTRGDIPERCPADNCAPMRISLFAEQLSATVAKPDESQLNALRYVVHLVGDIHQPLHDISDADLGGNCELLTTPVGTAKNLHALWDGGIIKEMDVSETSLTTSLLHELRSWNKSRRHQIVEGTVDDWVWEGHELAMADIYRKLHVPLQPVIFPSSCAEAPVAVTQFHLIVDGPYVDASKAVIREQLIKGGLRLAHILNSSL